MTCLQSERDVMLSSVRSWKEKTWSRRLKNKELLLELPRQPLLLLTLEN